MLLGIYDRPPLTTMHRNHLNNKDISKSCLLHAIMGKLLPTLKFDNAEEHLH